MPRALTSKSTVPGRSRWRRGGRPPRRLEGAADGVAVADVGEFEVDQVAIRLAQPGQRWPPSPAWRGCRAAHAPPFGQEAFGQVRADESRAPVIRTWRPSRVGRTERRHVAQGLRPAVRPEPREQLRRSVRCVSAPCGSGARRRGTRPAWAGRGRGHRRGTSRAGWRGLRGRGGTPGAGRARRVARWRSRPR